MSTKFSRLEEHLEDGPYFGGDDFSLVDAVFGTVFRYFDTFDQIGDFGIFPVNGKVHSWRIALAKRPSVRDAVLHNYKELLWAFLLNRKSHLSGIMTGAHDAKDTTPI